MDTLIIQIVSFQMVALVAIIGFQWALHRDMGNLRKEFGGDIADVRRDMAALGERMARVEVLLEGFIGRRPEPQA